MDSLAKAGSLDGELDDLDTNESREIADVAEDVNECFDLLHEAVYRYLLTVLANVADADDATQEVFLRLHRELAHGRKLKNVRAWLFRVAHNLAIDRKRARAPERLGQSFSDWPEDREPSCDAEGERQILTSERDQIIQKEITLLSPEERQCLELRMEGLRYREIAQVLGLRIPTVQRRLLKAVNRIAEAIGA